MVCFRVFSLTVVFVSVFGCPMKPLEQGIGLRGTTLAKLRNITTADNCRIVCLVEPNCTAWTLRNTSTGKKTTFVWSDYVARVVLSLGAICAEYETLPSLGSCGKSVLSLSFLGYIYCWAWALWLLNCETWQLTMLTVCRWWRWCYHLQITEWRWVSCRGTGSLKC